MSCAALFGRPKMGRPAYQQIIELLWPASVPLLDMNVICYLRVSTAEQADSGLGLEAQRASLISIAEHKNWNVVKWCVDAGATGKNMDRSGLREALLLLKRGEADCLAVSKLDRASRSVVDFAHLLETARREKWSFVAIDLNVDTSTPTGELLANVMMSVAQWERRTIGLRTKEALQAKKMAGYRLGRPVTIPGPVRAAIGRWRATGATWQGCADALNAAGVPTAHGGALWRASTCRGVMESARLDAEAEAVRQAGSQAVAS